MAVEGAALKIGPFSMSISGGGVIKVVDQTIHKRDLENVGHRTAVAVVEPKGKSQNPGAKAKRL
jgi:hypothetical protein